MVLDVVNILPLGFQAILLLWITVEDCLHSHLMNRVHAERDRNVSQFPWQIPVPSRGPQLKYVQFKLSEAGIHFDHPSALTVRVLTYSWILDCDLGLSR